MTDDEGAIGGLGDRGHFALEQAVGERRAMHVDEDQDEPKGCQHVVEMVSRIEIAHRDPFDEIAEPGNHRYGKQDAGAAGADGHGCQAILETPEPDQMELDAIRYLDEVLQVEDINLVESVQRGMNTPAFSQGRIVHDPDGSGKSEHAVHHFHGLVLDAYAKAGAA